VGRVEPAQVREFYAAFEGVTLLRRATIAQFARIAGAIEEDELIGFGLYQNDEETEPSEWRSLSKRDALRISEEIRVLLDRTGGAEVESRLPAALDPNAAAMLFKDRREHGGLAERVARLENEIHGHSEALQSLRGTAGATEQKLEKLLVAVDTFCDRATRQMERLPAPASPEPRKFRWQIPVTIAAVCALAGLAIFRGFVGPKPTAGRVQAAYPVAQTPAPAADKPDTPAAPKSTRVDLKALEPSWVAVYVDDKQTLSKVLDTNQTTAIASAGKVRVRLGNAGGVEITANGKPLGRLGNKGQVRTIEFTPAGFRFVSQDSQPKKPANVSTLTQ
jgi:hypothetical protein